MNADFINNIIVDSICRNDIDKAIIIKKYIASIDIGGHRAVLLDSDYKLIYADCDTIQNNSILGITTGAVEQGKKVDVISFGEIENLGWDFELNKPIFLKNEGNISKDPPQTGNIVEIGIATKQTALFINIKQNFLL